MSRTKHIGWDTLNRAAEASEIGKCLKSMDYHFLRTMTVASMQAMLCSTHHPKPNSSTIELTAEATLGLAELLFTEWDRSGFTEIFVELAPLALSLNSRAQAQLFALEQEMLSPLAIPVEAWTLIWEDYDRRAAAFERELTRQGASFRFSDSLADLERRAHDPNDEVYDLDVKGGHRVIGTGISMSSRPLPPISPGSPEYPWCWPVPPGSPGGTGPWPWPSGPEGPTRPWPLPSGSPGPIFPEPDDPFTGSPIIFHYSPFSWRKFFTVAASVVVGAANTVAAVPTAGVAVASVATAATVGGYYAGGGE